MNDYPEYHYVTETREHWIAEVQNKRGEGAKKYFKSSSTAIRWARLVAKQLGVTIDLRVNKIHMQ